MDDAGLDERFGFYRATVVEAEVVPGKTSVLSGAGATPDWPFPGVVHVITGHDPAGEHLGAQANAAANRAVAVSVMELGGRFVIGAGTAVDGSHAEESLVVWGLTRDQAVAVGRAARQDAIFELDAEEIRLVPCSDDRPVEVWARTAAPPGA